MEGQIGPFAMKKGLEQVLKGGVIMEVVTPENAKVAEDAGACAVMAFECVPADILPTAHMYGFLVDVQHGSNASSTGCMSCLCVSGSIQFST